MTDLHLRQVSQLAGTKPCQSSLLDAKKLVTDYYLNKPNAFNKTEMITFGTSGHRGTALKNSFNEAHILAIAEAISLWRKQNGITGPLFIGKDTHALSEPAMLTAIEVFLAHGFTIYYPHPEIYTPTPVISFTILEYNCTGNTIADGVILTASHNSPEDGGIKYNSPLGPADISITKWIEEKANEILKNKLKVKRKTIISLKDTPGLIPYDYLTPYVDALEKIIDFSAFDHKKIRLAIDPLGGAGIAYWRAIAERYDLDLALLNDKVDPTFYFLNLDWDGELRMDPCSKFIVNYLIEQRHHYDLIVALDTDHDRQGIITPAVGLLSPSAYMTVAISYLFAHRKNWTKSKGVGKNYVTSEMVDRVTLSLGRDIYEVPVGFRWFTQGLLNGTLGFCGEHSSGATFCRLNGEVWTTDKDGIVATLLAAEIRGRTGFDLGKLYENLLQQFGPTFYEQINLSITPQQKQLFKEYIQEPITLSKLAGDEIKSVQRKAHGNNADLLGIKLKSRHGWLALRPSGTENIFEIFAESYVSQEHLKQLLETGEELTDNIIMQEKEV